LIIEIEKHECLWKTNSKGFMNRESKRKSWEDVAKNIHGNWETFSNLEK